MNKSNVFGVGILIIILVVIGAVSYKVLVLNKENGNSDNNIVDNKEEKKIRKEQEGFEFEAEYMGESRWDYKIMGEKPTPCHEVKHDSVILESYPEQVTVNLSILSPEPDVICAQVEEDFEVAGLFQASKEAKVEFIVINQ